MLQGADIKGKNNCPLNNITPKNIEEVLWFAILSGNLQLVKRLEKGLIYNQLGNALGNYEMFKYILKRVNASNEDIYVAVRYSIRSIRVDMDVAKFLLNTDSEVEDSLLSRAIGYRNKELLEYLFKECYDNVYFAKTLSIDEARLLVESGFDYYGSIVEVGYNNGNLEVMEYGLKLGGRIGLYEEGIDDPLVLQLLREYK